MRNKKTLRATFDIDAAVAHMRRRADVLRRTQKFVRMGDFNLKVKQATKLLSFVSKQLENGFVITLPEHTLCYRLRVTKARVRELKRFLRECGIMFVPEAMRPRASWHAGKWLIRKRFLRFYDADATSGAPSCAPRKREVRRRSLRWNSTYYSFYDRAVVAVRGKVFEMIEVGVLDTHPAVRDRMILIHMEMRKLVADAGLTYDDLRWKPPAAKPEHVAVLMTTKNFIRVSPVLNALPLVEDVDLVALAGSI